MKTRHKGTDFAGRRALALRLKAEKLARGKGTQLPESLEAQSLEEQQRSPHELRGHQIEREVQTEELQDAHLDLEQGAAARTAELRQVNKVLRAEIARCKRAELVLRLKNLVFDESIAANSIVGLDGILTEVNAAFLRVWGYPSKDAVLGRPVRHFLNDPNEAAAIIGALNRTGQWEGDYTARRGDESVFIARGLATVVRDEQGKVIGYQSAVIDVSERKRSEEALRESEERLALAQGAASACVWVWDMTTERVTWAPELFRLFGLDPATAVASFETWRGIVHPEDLEPAEMRITVAARDHASLESEYRIVLPSGEVRWISAVGNTSYDTNGRPLRMAGICLDITKHKQAEAEKERLEAQNRQLQKAESLGRMAGAIAHHFNNQLQVVMMNLEMALNDLPQNAGLTENLTAAMQSAGKAAEVSSLMLTYLGETPCKRERQDLSEVCLRSLSLLRAALPQNVRLETSLPAPGPAISANVNLMQQVLTNLVTNAWEASKDGRGTIRLTVKTIPAAEIPAENRFPVGSQPQDKVYACLEVADAGCGIANRDIDKLFDPFFSSKFIGRGLGLSVSLGIVRSHHGVITVESKPGRGSTFRVFLPVSPEAVPHKPVSVVHATKTAGGGTMLVVDDNEAMRRAVALALKRLGFRVLMAEDGVEAVEVFRQHQADIRCVLCDLTMPRMNGWETLAALRKLAPGIPVILSSGYSEALVMEGCQAERPQAFLSKPYAFEALGEAIFRVLADRKE